jgi:hypothetical protein
MHVSRNKVEGTLGEVPLSALLDSCRRARFTGTIRILGAAEGTLTLRAGFVDEAQSGALKGEAAVDALMALRDGVYEVQQRLPDLGGMLGGGAQIEGEISEIPIAQVMRHIEENALSCSVTVIAGFDRGELIYNAGEIAEVHLNGQRDDDAIVTIVGWKNAKFRVAAPALDPIIAGRPKVEREPTAPFQLGGGGGTASDLAQIGVAPAVPLRAPKTPEAPPVMTAAGSTAPTPTPAPTVASTPAPVMSGPIEKKAEPASAPTPTPTPTSVPKSTSTRAPQQPATQPSFFASSAGIITMIGTALVVILMLYLVLR